MVRTVPVRGAVRPPPPAEAVAAEQAGCGPGEVGLAAVALGALLAAALYASDAGILFTRHFWLDEYLTSLIVRDPSVSHAIAAVRGGVDTNPPVYHLLLRAFCALTGGRPEVTFRAFALLCTGVALVATYAVLRRSFAVAPAALAVLALAGHRLVLKEAFEARFYAPLLAATACFALVFCRGGTRGPRGWARDVLVALAAALVCTLHYFGVIGMALIVAGDWLASRAAASAGRAYLRRLLPVAAGPVALLAMAPFVLGQREGLTVPTWMSPMTVESVVTFVESVFYALPLVIVLLAWFASRLWPRDASHASPAAAPSRPLAPVAGLVALAAVPLVVLLFSLLVQPSLAAKYAMAAVLALAPVTAALAAPLRPAAAGAVGVVLALVLYFNVSSLGDHSYTRDVVVLERVKIARARGGNQPIVTTSRDGAYMLHYVAPDLSPRVRIVDVRPFNPTLDDRLYLYEMDMARKVRRSYPTTPPVLDVAALRALGPFQFAGSTEELAWLGQRVPLQPAGPGLWEVK